MSKSKFDIEHLLKLEAIFQNSLFGIIVLDGDAMIESINNKLAMELQLNPREIEGKSIYQLLDDENKTIIKDYLNSIIYKKNSQDQPKTINVRFRISQEKNTYLKLGVLETTIKDKLFLIGILEDITPEKKLRKGLKEEEAQNKQHKENLEKEKAVAELKTRFVSMASHEFRSPIAGMLGSVNLIEKYIHSAQKEWNQFTYKNHIENHIGVLRKALGNLQSILNGFLSVGRLDSGKLKIHIQTFNLSEFLYNYEKQVKDVLKPEQPLTFHCKNCNTLVKMDKNFLHNILNNLISNAMKYSASDQPIDVFFTVDDKRIRLIVVDRGKGIPIEQQPYVFEHFFRADNVKNYNGTGLGLTITKKYTELMQGEINFESQEGMGTKFILTFPLSLINKQA